jgi:hypothetical protein
MPISGKGNSKKTTTTTTTKSIKIGIEKLKFE